MARDITLIVLATAVLVILVSGEAKNNSTSSIIKSIGGSGSTLIAALQGRAVTDSAFGS